MTNSNVEYAILETHEIKKRIDDAVLSMESGKPFDDVIHSLPDDPELFRFLGDELINRNKKESALVSYNLAADLYIKSTMTLQAIVSKILEWSILKPSHAEGRAFHSYLQTQEIINSPLQNFFTGMSYPELVSVILRLVRVRAKKDAYITKSGDAGNEIYFIVSGQLEESSYDAFSQASHPNLIPAVALGRNDMFGDIFPLEKDTFHCSYVKAVTDVELVKISKPVLKSVCYKHPRIWKLMENISRNSHIPGTKRQWKRERKSERCNLPANVALSLGKTENPEKRRELSGVTKDICKDGACVSLNMNNGYMDQSALVDSDVELEIKTRRNNSPINASGSIVWYKTLPFDPSLSCVIGIRFQEIDKKNMGLIKDFCSETSGDQEMLWDLWSDMMT